MKVHCHNSDLIGMYTVPFTKKHAKKKIGLLVFLQFQVIMGGGRQALVTNTTASAADPLDTWGCIRRDGRNLIDSYRQDKEERGLRYNVVQNNRDLRDLNVNETDYLLGKNFPNLSF